jgi:hypothetical protein
MGLAKDTRTVWSRLSIAPVGKNKVISFFPQKESWRAPIAGPDALPENVSDFQRAKAETPSHKTTMTAKRMRSFFLYTITKKKYIKGTICYLSIFMGTKNNMIIISANPLNLPAVGRSPLSGGLEGKLFPSLTREGCPKGGVGLLPQTGKI